MIVSEIWRYPIKSLGAERISGVELHQNRTLPWDRVWALLHKESRADINNPKWMNCQAFLRGAVAPLFSAVNAKFDEKSGVLLLTHPKLNSLTLNLFDREVHEKLLEWVVPLCPAANPEPLCIYELNNRGITDTDYPSVSINSKSSLQALSEIAGDKLNTRRFRGNIWLEDLDPWVEFDWQGKKLLIGESVLEVVEPIKRCNTTKTNTKTGIRDIDILSLLQNSYGHKNFGVYCKVVRGGKIYQDSIATFL